MVENIIGFSFIIKLVKDGKDFQIDRVVVKGTDMDAAEAEANVQIGAEVARHDGCHALGADLRKQVKCSEGVNENKVA